jgi:ribosomal-protein-alanine N-acetyltransferase
MDADVEPFIVMNKDVDVMKHFPNLLTDAETLAMIERIQLHFDKNGFGLYAVENKSTGQFIGFTGFSIPVFDTFFTPCVEIGWRYGKEYWHQGFATEAAGACLQYGFNSLGFENIYSFTAVINQPSENIMKRIGMTEAGMFEHPDIDKSHILCKHVVYRIDKPSYMSAPSA